MCPMCAASLTVWLLAGGTGGAAAVTSGLIYRKSRQKRLIANADKSESVQNIVDDQKRTGHSQSL
jgi:hypothetical protein